MGSYRQGRPGRKAEIIACDGNFHGRTITIVGMSSGPVSARLRSVPARIAAHPHGDPGRLPAAPRRIRLASWWNRSRGGGIVLPPPGFSPPAPPYAGATTCCLSPTRSRPDSVAPGGCWPASTKGPPDGDHSGQSPRAAACYVWPSGCRRWGDGASSIRATTVPRSAAILPPQQQPWRRWTLVGGGSDSRDPLRWETSR